MAEYSAEKLMKVLSGSWNISREIINRGEVFNVIGHAVFTAHDDGLLYTEEVLTELPGANALKGTQQYFYKFSGNTVQIFKYQAGELGELFMNLALEQVGDELRAKDSHLCIADTYDGQFVFKTSNEFSTEYKVQGPEKDYKIRTTYRQSKTPQLIKNQPGRCS